MLKDAFDFKEFCKRIAEGAKLEDFEITWGTRTQWRPIAECPEYLISPYTEFRTIPKTIEVNGFEIPAPLDKIPENGETYYLPSIFEDKYYVTFYVHGGRSFEDRLLERGLMHSSKENAIMHAKAMLGIDPST